MLFSEKLSTLLLHPNSLPVFSKINWHSSVCIIIITYIKYIIIIVIVISPWPGGVF